MSTHSPINPWPDLNFHSYKATYETLHRWVQVVGKLRTSKLPWVNHAWSSTLQATARGLTTGLVAEKHRGFSVDFDFIDHKLVVLTTEGLKVEMLLRSESVANFYRRFREVMENLSIPLSFAPRPDELSDRVRFVDDDFHCSYEPNAAHSLWQAMVQVDRVFKIFRAGFLGKCSPVHFFWGSFDLAVTRFSGRRAPEHPAGVPNLSDTIVREAYSHEVSSAGFWPGGDMLPQPVFYSYAYPQPQGFENSKVQPETAYFHEQLREFILPYDEVRHSPTPDHTLRSFLQSTYNAAADLGRWDRKNLEESPYLVQMQRLHAIGA